jgi:ribosomal protein S3AE
MAKIRKKKDNLRIKKKWFPVVAPEMFSGHKIAEIPSYNIELLVGRSLSVNLMSLTRDPKKQGTTIKFRIDSIKGDSASTQTVGLLILPSSIKRMVRRNRNRIDGSYKVKTEDNMIVQIKPILLTRHHAKGSVVRELREKVRSLLIKNISRMKYVDFVKNVVSGYLQKSIYAVVSKVYPVVLFEIRSFNLIKKLDNTEEISPDTNDINEENIIDSDSVEEDLDDSEDLNEDLDDSEEDLDEESKKDSKKK